MRSESEVKTLRLGKRGRDPSDSKNRGRRRPVLDDLDRTKGRLKEGLIKSAAFTIILPSALSGGIEDGAADVRRSGI